MNRHRSIRMLFTTLVLGCLVVFAGNAAFGRGGLFHLSSAKKPTVTSSPCVAPTNTTSDQGSSAAENTSDEGTTSDEATSDQGNQSDETTSDEGDRSDQCQTTAPDQAPTGTKPPQGSADRAAQCAAAAGITVKGSSTTQPAATGLDHAIQVVMANCIKNPQAPGLLNALQHLVQNRDRQLAREAAKAERQAAKAGRHAAGGHGHGHGG